MVDVVFGTFDKNRNRNLDVSELTSVVVSLGDRLVLTTFNFIFLYFYVFITHFHYSPFTQYFTHYSRSYPLIAVPLFLFSFLKGCARRGG
jgi:hypothetical protein